MTISNARDVAKLAVGFIICGFYLGAMIRRFLCLIILTAMVVHSAGRLGALSYLYEKRHLIAHSIGFIAEIPIAVCNSDFDFGTGLRIQDSESAHKMPACMQAHEINLFFVSELGLKHPQEHVLSQDLFVANPGNYSPVSLAGVFHPPLI